MVQEIEITLLPQDINNDALTLQKIASALNVPKADIASFTLLKKAIDSRQRVTCYRLKYQVNIGEVASAEGAFNYNYKNVMQAKPCIIIGAGPAGIFAALKCLQLGIKPVIIERGKDIRARRRDLAQITKTLKVNPESNYCFGEGGAGTYSDGKLYTRSSKRGDINEVLGLLVAHGAPTNILTDARPHIGTNKLPQIIEAMRQTILDYGGEVHFEKKLTDITIKAGKLTHITLNNSETIEAKSLILATGHSARDIFYLLHAKNILLEAKPLAIGVRAEHPQSLIDSIQYHCDTRHENLPPAYYNLVEQVDGRGVFSFCMCPGGIIAPCATDAGEIVVNGWSPSKRNNLFANTGMVVQVNLEDLNGDYIKNPLLALEYQHAIEQKAFNVANNTIKAPAQRMVDFVQNKISSGALNTSYLPGVTNAQLADVLPPFISQRLKNALPLFNKKMPGYFTNEAILVGVESRSSSPVRIPRDKITLMHPEVKGLFPCGEGAGYAGGIVSAAMDGINCAKAVFDLKI